MQIDLSILIVNFNGGRFLKDCIESIFSSECKFSYEVIVCDNNSQDNSIDILESFTPQIKLIKSKKNIGFSKGNNLCAQHSTGEYLFLLNNDTILEKKTLEHLLSFIKKTKNIGAVAPKLLNTNGSLQCPGGILGQWKYRTKKPVKLSFLSGAAVMLSKKTYLEVGGLDPNFFFYNEDIDLCMNLRKKGYDLYYYPKAQMIHHGGESTKTRKAGSVIEGYRGGLYLCYKHYPKIIFYFYRLILFFDLLPRFLFHAILSRLNKQHLELAKAYLGVMKINLNGQINNPRIDD